MENKKICIAIDTKDKKNNIIRTVNAIKRQTSYENITVSYTHLTLPTKLEV